MSRVPTVSAVVAAYNFERFVGAAIDSVLAQDHPVAEIIVVDDGSADGTADVVAAYGPRVRLIRKENGGHLSTFDRGIGEATGDYIALLDGDDTWHPGKTREQVAMLEAHPEIGLVHGDLRVVAEDGAELAPSFFAERGIEHVEGELLWMLLRHNTITTSAVMVRGALRDRFHPIPPWARVQDWWLGLRVSEVARIGCVHAPVADYRRHGSNLNHGRSGRRRAELMRDELPLRRRLLTGTATDRLSAADAAAALTAFELASSQAAEGLGTSRRTLVPVGAAERAAAEQERSRAAAAGDRDEAGRRLVAALAHDPWNGTARQELAAVLRAGKGVGTVGVGDVAPAAEPERQQVDGARPFAALADAAELAERPELLRAWGESFSSADEATLVIRLGSDADALPRLEGALAAAGLDGEDAPDLLAVAADGPGARALSYYAARVDAVLSETLPPGALAALPCAASDGTPALPRLARRIAGDRDAGPSFAINICAPDWWRAPSWGDLHFARAIQQELHRRGLPCAIHTIDGWAASRRSRFDVVLHLRGLTPYEVDPGQLNVLWSISHPELLTDAECEASDVVAVASAPFAERLRARCETPVHVLEQATDPAVFFPEPDPGLAHELVFVGNSRRVRRPVIADLLPTERDLAIWGGDWQGLVDARHVRGTYLPNDRVRGAYSSAGIVLNDHWDDMRANGFASNRLYDAVACGALVISDRLDGVEERFGGAVVTYEGRDELHALVEHFLAHPEERAERGRAGRERVLAEHTFARRVDELLALLPVAVAA